MKILYGILGLIIIAGGAWYFFNTEAPAPSAEPEGNAMMEEAVAPTPGTYTVDTEASEIGWEARKPLIPGYVHHGTIGLSDGAIEIGESEATGSFTIDMNTIRVTSLGGGKEGRESQLETHLKSDDFFDVEAFSEAEFVIASVSPLNAEMHQYTITGSLTMKGVTNEVSFPAEIYEENGALKADAEFDVDRTKWGIRYGSGSFFDDLAENAIGDSITLTLSLVAHPESSMMMEEEN